MPISHDCWLECSCLAAVWLGTTNGEVLASVPCFFEISRHFAEGNRLGKHRDTEWAGRGGGQVRIPFPCWGEGGRIRSVIIASGAWGWASERGERWDSPAPRLHGASLVKNYFAGMIGGHQMPQPCWSQRRLGQVSPWMRDPKQTPRCMT